jgi:hypothetical protein
MLSCTNKTRSKLLISSNQLPHLSLYLTAHSYSQPHNRGRNLASEFIRLPNKRLFQDYYTLIKHPTSLEIVHDKLRQTFSSLSPPGIGPSSTSDTPGLNKSSTGNNGTKIKIKLNTFSTSTSSTPAPAAPNLEGASYAGTTGEGEDYKGYSNIEEVKKDFDLIWSNAKRCEFSLLFFLFTIIPFLSFLIIDYSCGGIDNQKESGIFKDAQKLHVCPLSLSVPFPCPHKSI